MDTQLFKEFANTLATRRPAWQFIVEDNVIRILTHQFQVDMTIFLEQMEKDKDLVLIEVTLHRDFGCVVTMKSNIGI